MSPRAKLGLGLVVAVVAATLFLVPVASISLETPCSTFESSATANLGVCSPEQAAGTFGYASGTASVTYVVFGVGAVLVKGYETGGSVYCLAYGNPGSMCGLPWERT